MHVLVVVLMQEQEKGVFRRLVWDGKVRAEIGLKEVDQLGIIVGEVIGNA